MSDRWGPNAYFHKRLVLVCFPMLIHLPSARLKKNDKLIGFASETYFALPASKTKIQKTAPFFMVNDTFEKDLSSSHQERSILFKTWKTSQLLQGKEKTSCLFCEDTPKYDIKMTH